MQMLGWCYLFYIKNLVYKVKTQLWAMTPNTEVSKSNYTLIHKEKAFFNIDCKSHPWISESGSWGGSLRLFAFNHILQWSLSVSSAGQDSTV